MGKLKPFYCAGALFQIRQNLMTLHVLFNGLFGMSYLQNQKVKTVFLCDLSIYRNLCLKLQKVDKGYGTHNSTGKQFFLTQAIKFVKSFFIFC